MALCGVARAQDSDLQPLLDRLDRLERDVNVLQRQVYQGQGSSQNNSAGRGPAAAATPQSALNNELAVSQLQDQMRTLTGKMEEIGYNLDQLKTRLDRLSSDVDLRFSQLGVQSPANGAAAPPPLRGGRPAPVRHPPPPAAPQTLGSLDAGAAPPAPASTTPQPQQAGAPAGGELPSGSPQDQYNYAFGLLRRADYPAAAQALRAFVQRYPRDPLAGNAQYWLGETYYVRKDYKNAASAFAEGYQKYPRGPKAPDNLLKLGMTLGNLGQKSDACKAFARLDHDFPGAATNVKEQEASERHSLRC